MQRAAYARLLSGLQTITEQPHHQPTATSSAPPPPPSRPPSRPRSRTAVISRDTATHPSFPRGPLAVIDQEGEGLIAHFADQKRTDTGADHLLDLVHWALNAGIGRARLHKNARNDADPLLVLTLPAMQYLGLPPALDNRNQLRLPDSHPEISRLRDAGFRLTRSGFGPWARVYLPVENGKRSCVQLALTGWGALSDRDGWNLPDLQPGPLAALLGTYADRVITPAGSTAVCGQELMTALRPATRADYSPAAGRWVSAQNANALVEPLEPAPPEAHDAHPLAKGRRPEDAMNEEAWDWSRPPADDEATTYAHVVGIDINLAFVAAASSLDVGLNAPPRHAASPPFDPKVPGTWLCDFSQAPHDPRLPSIFTPHGLPPTGPAWYATPTLTYAAEELDLKVKPLQAYLRDDKGRYLAPWYKHLRNAYLETMADAGVHENMTPEAFLRAMQNLPDAGPELLALLKAIKATGKGGIGKLREGPRGTTVPYQRWAALDTPTWRPDIRAAVISKARTLMHGKMRKLADLTGRYPLAALSDCAVYPAHQPTATDVVPSGDDGSKLPGHFHLGVNPGYAKQEGTRPMSWYLQQHHQNLNPARHIKGS
ncbi:MULTISPECIES: transcriptional regulator [unclassified Streptomyces]|uniref:telomere-associated protein Tap n=1 Tax=unclassified Streptomyces TaxID=2593676 RepID=UPI001F103863|nr:MULTISPECIES: transcriptional regulator [unclassified Streptomyces]